MYRNRVLGIAAWLNLVVVCASGGAHGTRQEGLRVFQPLASPNSTVQERWRSSTFDIIASTEPRSLPLGLQHDTAASQRLAVLPACGASLPRRYDQLHVYEQLRVWESADCYNPLLFNTSQHANRSQTKSSQSRVGVLEELIAVIVIFGECVRTAFNSQPRRNAGSKWTEAALMSLFLNAQITLGVCFVDWVVVQVPGFAFCAVHNVIGLVVGGITAAAHHLLFASWYLQWFPESNIYLVAPMLQIVLSFSTGLLYASAMQRLAELHYERRRMILQARYPPPARSY